MLARDEEIQRLVHGLSHDMGAPLRAVVQFSQLLSRRLGNRLNEREAYWLQLIEDGGLQAQAMIEALLTFSRLATRMQPTRPFQLEVALEGALRELGDEMTGGALIDCPQTACEIEGDPGQWQFFLRHVLHNALLFQAPGNPPHVRIGIRDGKDTVEIRVEDNGIGVAEAKRSDLCLPFKRLNTVDEFPGIGMGLSYCDRIAGLHNGRLSFSDSSLGGLAVICVLDRATSGDGR